jgi:uracil phosphoribosyltransferase
MVAPRYAGDAVVSCHPQNVIQPKIQLTMRKCFFGANSAAQRYCAADVGDIEAYSAREAHVQRVPMKQKKKPYTKATWKIQLGQSYLCTCVFVNMIRTGPPLVRTVVKVTEYASPGR